MSTNVAYQVQAEVSVARSSVIPASEMFTKGTSFNTNDADLGSWAVDADGYLVNKNSQYGYSGLYQTAHLNWTDYNFTIPMTGSALGTAIIGCHFRFVDRWNHYYVAWDNGAVWGAPQVRLYKIRNNVTTLLATHKGLSWVSAKLHMVRVELAGASITVKIDDAVIFGAVPDGASPHLTGAFGPLTYSQKDARFGSPEIGNAPAVFTVVSDLTGDVPLTSYDPSNASKLQPETLAVIMKPAVDAYCAGATLDASRATYRRFTVSTATPDAAVYFAPATQATTTTDKASYVWGHVVRALIVPKEPANLVGTLQSNNDILWTWVDQSDNEDGFYVLNEFGATVAQVTAGTTAWLETGTPADTVISRKVVAFNTDGRSVATALVSVRTAPVAPPAPLSFTGVALSDRAIAWSWVDGSNGKAQYRLLDTDNTVIATISQGATSYSEGGLLEATGYRRRLVAFTAGGDSPVVEAEATTLAKPGPVKMPPLTPLDLTGVPLSDTQIEWTWEMDTPCDGFKLYDEGDTLVAVLPATMRMFTEINLYPGVTYFRRLVAFNADGSSDFSNLASATTLEAGEGEEDYLCHPVEMLAAGERLPAFQSGIGDALDLKAHRPSRTLTPEQFAYNLQIQGEVPGEITVFPRKDFTFRFRADGLIPNAVNSGKFLGSYAAYPMRPYRARVDGLAEVPEAFSWETKADAQYVSSYTDPTDAFSWHAKADAQFVEGYDKETDAFTWTAEAKGMRFTRKVQDMATVFASWTKFGDGDWKYDAATSELYNLFNSIDMTGYYDPSMIPGGANEARDYTISTQLKIATASGDNDLVGLAFRIKDVRNYYYVGWVMDSGAAVPLEFVPQNGLLQLMKVVAGQHVTIKSAPAAPGWTYDVYNSMEVEVVGSNIKVRIGGVEWISATDTDFSSGAWGPVSYSQPNSFFKDLTATDTQAVAISAPAKADTVSYVNTDVASAKQLTVGTLAAYMAPYVADYKTANAVADVDLRIDSYLLTDDSATATLVSIADGSESVKAYTSQARVPRWVPTTFTSPAVTETLTTDVHQTLATAKRLTTGTVAQYLATQIQDFKTSRNLAESEFKLGSYEVLDDSATVTVSTGTTNGSDAAWAYTSKRKRTNWTPVTLATDPVSASITDVNGSAAAQKDLAGGKTAEQLLASQVASFKASKSLQDAEFKIDRYYAAQGNATVVISTKADGKGLVTAYTTAGTRYQDSRTAEGNLRILDGTINLPLALILKNRLGATYTGNAATYTLTDLSGEPETTVKWDDGTTAPRGTMTSLVTATTAKAEILLDRTMQSDAPPVAINPPAMPPAWTDVLYILTKTGPNTAEGSNSFGYVASVPGTRLRAAGQELRLTQGELFYLTASVRYEDVPWTGYGEWYPGQVNGRAPMKRDGSGYAPMNVPIAMTIPPSVKQRVYGLELADGTQDVTWFFSKSAAVTTQVDDDVVALSSDHTETRQQPNIWMGPRVQGSALRVSPGDTLAFTEEMQNPALDPLWQELPVKPIKYRLLVSSSNPNVLLEHTAAEQVDWVPTGAITPAFVRVSLSAQVRNRAHGSWHPRLHNGYYYLNDEEHFLYVDDGVSGKLREEEYPEILQFFYRLKATGRRFLPEQTETMTGNFKAGRGVGVVVNDTIRLEPGANAGEFIGPTVICDRTAAWQPITIERTGPGTVDVLTRSFTGVWSPWQALPSTSVPASPNGTRLEYKLALGSAEFQQKVPATWTQALDTDFSTGTLLQNVVAQGGLRLAPEKREGVAYGPVMDLKDPAFVSSMGTVALQQTLPDGASYVLYTVSADTPDGPWDGTGESWAQVKDGNVASRKKRYLRWVLVLRRGTSVDGPAVTNMTTTVDQFTIIRETPIVTGVTAGALMPATTEQALYEATLRSTLVADTSWQVIGTDTAEAQMLKQLSGTGYATIGLILDELAISTTDPRIAVRIQDELVEARALAEVLGKRMSQTKIIVDESNQAEVSPAPRQGAPVVIYDALGLMHQVHFTDHHGLPTLDDERTYTEGGRTFALPYLNIDPDTLAAEVDWDGDGGWDAVLGWTLCNNQLRLPVRVPRNVKLRVHYRLTRSYVVDYNFNESGDTARIKFHGVIPFSNAPAI